MNNDPFYISIHHIGGRSGSRIFPILQMFEHDLENVMYEADESCIAQIKERLKNYTSKVSVLPYCIAGHTGEATFYIRRNRYNNSLLLHNTDYCHLFSYDSQFHWESDPLAFELDKVIKLKVITLNDLYTDANAEAAPPNFLSLDTEGSEYDILSGSESLLRSKIIAIQSEVSFVQLYKSQKLFHDIQNLLKKYYFTLSDLEVFKTDGMSAEQLPIGLRGKGIFGHGEALFFKNPSFISKNHSNPLLDLLKGAFISFVFFRFEQTFAYLKELRLAGGKEYLEDIRGKKNYLQFIKQFIELSDGYPNIFPVKFSTYFHTPDSAKDRFTNKGVHIDIDELRKRYFLDVSLTEFKKYIHTLVTNDYIGIESLCEKYNLKQHADLLREKRVQQTIGTLMRLGFLNDRGDGKYELKNDTIQNL